MEEHNNNSGRPPGGGDNNKNPRNRQSILLFLIIALVAILFWNFIGNRGSSSEEITYNEFLDMLESGKIAEVFGYPAGEENHPHNATRLQR